MPDPFLRRIRTALNVSHAEMRTLMEIESNEYRMLLDSARGRLAAVNRDIGWTNVAERVDRQIGLLLSVREELNRKLGQDRKQQMAQRLRIAERPR